MQSFPRQWIEQYIAIDTVTDRSNEAGLQFLLPLLRECGLHTEVQRVREKGVSFFNLVATPSDQKTDPQLVLHTHLDTVHPGDSSQWTETGGAPFRATFKGDRVFGLGTADVKLDLLCKIWAAKHARPTMPFAIVGSYGEERGLVGTKKLLAAKKIRPKFALVGEPSKLELIYAHKGHLVAQIELPLERDIHIQLRDWQGKAAHSSTPALGINAIERCLKWLEHHPYGVTRLEGGSDSNRIPDRCEVELCGKPGTATRSLISVFKRLKAFGESLQKHRDRRFSPSSITLSFNLARSARGKVRLTFDMRLLPETDPAKLIARIEKIVEKHGRVLSIAVDPPLDGTKDSALIRHASASLKTCGIPTVIQTKASSTEAALYYEKGAQAIVFGPGVSVGNVHRPNEHCSLDQLDAATRFYTDFLSSPWERT